MLIAQELALAGKRRPAAREVLFWPSEIAASGVMAGRALAVTPSIARIEKAVVNCFLEALVGNDQVGWSRLLSNWKLLK